MVLWVLVFIGRRQQVNHLGSLNTLFPPSIYGIDGSKVIMTVYKFKVASRDFISRGTNELFSDSRDYENITIIFSWSHESEKS